MSATIAVIGAGIAGLGAAYSLQRAGCRVMVFERAPVVGGRMQTLEAEGYRWDAGAQFMVAGEYATMEALMGELRVAMSPHPISPAQASALPGGRLWRTRLSSPGAFLRHPSVPWAQKVRAGLAFARALGRARRAGLDLSDFHHPEAAAPLDDLSLRAWGDRAIGPEAVDYFLSLPTSMLFFWSAEETPWWLTMGLAQQALRWKAVVPEGGMGAVPNAMARQLDVRLGHRVQRVERASDGSLRLAVESAEGLNEARVDGVILATPAPHAWDILTDPEALLGPERASYLASARYVSNLTTAIAYRSPIEQQAYGIGIPLAMNEPLAAIAWENMKGPDRVPPGTSLAVAMPTHAYSTANWHRDEGALGEELTGAVDRYYPGSNRQLAFHRVARWRHAIPLFPPGRARELARALAQPATAPVVACGDYWMGACTEQALLTGQRAAAELLTHLRTHPPLNAPTHG